MKCGLTVKSCARELRKRRKAQEGVAGGEAAAGGGEGRRQRQAQEGQAALAAADLCVLRRDQEHLELVVLPVHEDELSLGREHERGLLPELGGEVFEEQALRGAGEAGGGPRGGRGGHYHLDRLLLLAGRQAGGAS